MISIITNIYNQLGANRLFYESLVETTKNKFELIIINNNSNDGSREYFKQKDNVKIIDTGGNYNYPYCQNLGITYAQHAILCFFNNDIILSKKWDERMLSVFSNDCRIKVLSFATNDHLENKEIHKKIARKWKRVKHPIQFILGNTQFSLKMMLNLMYNNFDHFAEERFKKWQYETIEGYSGSAIAMKREILDQIGLFDERIQDADYDLFNRLKKASLIDKKILPIQLALGIYVHHFQKLTSKKIYPSFINNRDMISIEDKWGNDTNQLRKDIVG